MRNLHTNYIINGKKSIVLLLNKGYSSNIKRAAARGRIMDIFIYTLLVLLSLAAIACLVMTVIKAVDRDLGWSVMFFVLALWDGATAIAVAHDYGLIF